MTSSPTANESEDNAWARLKVQEWVDNVEGNYCDTQLLARAHPIALGVYCVGLLFGDGERGFSGSELADMNHALCEEPIARLMIEIASGQDRPDGVDSSENSTRGYVADTLARRDVQGIDWEELALDLLGVERGDDDAPEWARDGDG